MVINPKSNRRNQPSVRLLPEIYEAWLKENPKEVAGGPIELIPNSDSEDENDVCLEAYHIDSNILPEHYAKDLLIFGIFNEFEGFKIWVTPKQYDYLLMAHQNYDGPFTSADGKKFENHPHFHEIDYYYNVKSRPGNRRKVPSMLYPNINSADFLNAFMQYYYIDDGRDENVLLPSRPLKIQKGLDEFN